MIKPHIRKLSPGSRIFECASRGYRKGAPYKTVQGHGLSPVKAFEDWKKRLDFLIEKYSYSITLEDGVAL